MGDIKADQLCEGDSKEVNIEMETPGGTGKRTVGYSIDYDYSGFSQLNFNIWKRGTENQWGGKQKSETYGPVKVDINPEFLLKRIVHGQTETVTEWVEEGQRFTLKIDIRSVGPDSAEIKINNLKLKFQNMHPEGDCDFNSDGSYKGELKAPTKEPLKCNMVVDSINKEWVTGSIEVDYDYNYKIIRQQEFNID